MDIKVPDMNDSLSAIIIDKKEYLLRFTYNEISDCWSFGIYDSEENPLMGLTRIVPNYPITHFCNIDGLPAGVFGAVRRDGIDKIGRRDFAEGNAQFVYLSESLSEGA